MKALKILLFLLKFFVGCAFIGTITVFAAYMYYSKDLPDVAELKVVRLQTPMQVLSADGELIASFGEHRRIPLKYEDMPQSVINAVIATEDSRFYSHYGVDPIGIMRAVFIALKSGSLSQGGSTITQQVAKNFFLTPEKSIGRKIREMILAIRMEKELTKEEIMALYLNKIYFGSRSYGIGSAAATFFGKTADQLTLSESALLAGLPNAPSAYNPISYPERAISRRNWVLHRMLDQEYITQEQYDEAIAEPLNVSYHVPKVAFSAPYVAEMARQFMYEKFGEFAYSDGYKVYTTITQKNQVAATTSVRHHVLDYDMRHGYRGPEKVLWQEGDTAFTPEQIQQALSKYMTYGGGMLLPAVVTKSTEQAATAVLSNGEAITINYDGMKWARSFISDNAQGPTPKTVSAVIKEGQQIWVRQVDKNWQLSQIPAVNSALVSVDSNTGAITALVGGFDFNLSKFNRATQAIRQIGSNIKPFIYTAALDKGLTMATILNDAPILRTSAGSEAWRPKNSPATYAGPLRLRVGLATSKNVMMVRAARAIGINYAADYLERFGFPRSNISRNESLALGSASFTPLQVARGYSVIANGGYLVTPYVIERIEYSEGGVIYEHVPEVACSDCLQELAYAEEDKQNISLDHVENVVTTTDGDTPDQNALTADSGFVLPENIPFERLPVDENQPKPETQPESQQPVYAPHVISSELAFIIKDALKTAVWGEKGSNWLGTAWRSRNLNRHDIGGKTGTTNLSKDVWFSGFGPDIVTTVWMGFDDHRRELGRARQNAFDERSYISAEGGARTVNPLWNDYMQVVLKGVPQKTEIQPNKVISVLIDRKTGMLATPDSNSIEEYFIEGTEPTQYSYKETGTQVTDEQGNTSELF
ncbi:transglycosylase domain-containing protein [Zophobihabitans entericus]|uniref:Penicillin-binding protein 1A n=1 Tax=Zophobihabitans entericus TaxID=1635327 RepID=A0A6G9IB84_9GAMM|nr:transglycosylase domain-containing protein [Zophobihabitans entericus]QIQ21483.1 peptidoglycan glycosyltransferase/peptidoglycan DD-transpeptidase MrcA [Zophobihabitans entericus]